MLVDTTYASLNGSVRHNPHNNHSLSPQVSLLNSEMPADIVNPLRMKYAMYLAFLVLVLISAGMEVSQTLVSDVALPIRPCSLVTLNFSAPTPESNSICFHLYLHAHLLLRLYLYHRLYLFRCAPMRSCSLMARCGTCY